MACVRTTHVLYPLHNVAFENAVYSDLELCNNTLYAHAPMMNNFLGKTCRGG